MSGPKVVRVVTREEVAARCRAAMAELRSVAHALKSQLSKHAASDDAAVAAVDARIAVLEGELDALRVNGLEARIANGTAFMRSEIARVQAEAERKLVLEREVGRRSIGMARTLLEALGAGDPLSGQLNEGIDAARGLDPGALERLKQLTDAAYEVLKRRTSDPAHATADQELASRLLQGQEGVLQRWTAPRSQLDSRLESVLAQCAILGVEGSAFERRAGQLTDIEDSGRKAAMTDSLILEVANAVARQKRLMDVRINVDSVRERLTVWGASEPALTGRLDAALAAQDEETLARLLQEADRVIATRMAAQAASSRRRSILEGLSKLGYTVEPSMETAWATSGRLVVTRPDDKDYGVEIGAPGSAELMQVRLVGAANPSTPRSRQQDTHVEQEWCAEFERLRRFAAEAGADVVIQRATGVGVEPVKSVANADLERVRIADSLNVTPQTLKR